jgi:hypothetical protein
MKNPTAEIGTAHTAQYTTHRNPMAEIGTAHTVNDKQPPQHTILAANMKTAPTVYTQ